MVTVNPWLVMTGNSVIRTTLQYTNPNLIILQLGILYYSKDVLATAVPNILEYSVISVNIFPRYGILGTTVIIGNMPGLRAPNTRPDLLRCHLECDMEVS